MALPIPLPPARYELLASYLARLAAVHGLDPADLHAHSHRLDTTAWLAALTDRRPADLAAALPELRLGGHDPVLFRHEPQPGCPRCDARHAGGPVLRLLPHSCYLCPRHACWIGPPDIPAPTTDLSRLPELLTAHRRHQRLLHRHGPLVTYDAVLTGYLICGHLWARPAADRPGLAERWNARATALIGDPYAGFTASRLFAAAYPEAVDLAVLIADPGWRRRAHGNPVEQQAFLAALGHHLDRGGPYRPSEHADAVAHWMHIDAARPPVQPPARKTIPGPRLPGFGTGKANQDRHERSRYWYSRNHDGGRVILHHRHVRPVLIRPWSPAMDGIEAAVWASAALPEPPRRLTESAN